MGEMLTSSAEDQSRETRGGDRRSKSPDVTLKPALADIGLTKRESADTQRLASLPRETFDKVKAGTKTRTEARREQLSDVSPVHFPVVLPVPKRNR
jgi:hypothetical protein